MPQIQDEIDLFFSSSGDLALDESKDIASTEGDPLLSFRQECFNRIKSETNDWQIHEWIGGDLQELIGEPNSRETAERGKEKIENALTIGAFVNIEDVNIKYVPISRDVLMYVVKIAVEPTESNGLTDFVQINLLLDINNNKLTVS